VLFRSVGTALRYALTGDNTSKFRDTDGNDYDINIALDPADRSKTANLDNFTFMNSLGQPVELQEFAKITETTGPTSLRRENRRYGIIVSSQAIGRSAGTISMDIMKKVSKIKFASGIEFGYYGNMKNMMESFLSLFIALLGAIFFIYMVMAALYNSFIYPFIVLFSIPLGIAGSLLAMALTMNSMSIFTILGMIMQLGLVTKNAILLVDFTNKFRENGADVNSALVEAGKERLRPILMTTLTMILGMLPVALSNAMGAELKRGLAWALIGGLTVSMIMTLLVVPVVYTIVAKIRENALDPRKSLNDKQAVA
jgi:hydrophobic/amphiphilic exporter-1 (mainly G- bacteria), HAE1 family